ncbi:hypothetical protein IE81DRAFT_324314 [Ceraceosorus guamensis]|uniref:RNA-dependent RNA polymerase n=1 Tax=Ceraceosorus guamensis TaxID=1522189 RepID=A0A316VVL5_9BASI|nr:hypothetical protein IE81DRAFT_324314 [Ceraceosorus guamensis]PWN41687.1 hypothetical protein IE81DRAFT_324314 [Ceraceosorus guamensis]
MGTATTSSPTQSPSIGPHSSRSTAYRIADPGLLQRRLDANAHSPQGVPWLMQFYLAGLVSRKRLDWDKLSRSDLLKQLRQPTAMDAVERLLQPNNRALLWKGALDGCPFPKSVLSAFKQYDEESSSGQQGRICLRGVVATEASERFSVRLAPPKLSPSTRVTRRFGSTSVLRLRLDEKTAKSVWDPKQARALRDFLCLPMILCGRTYRAFTVRDGAVLFFVIDGAGLPSNHPQCIWDLYSWMGEWRHNEESLLVKYLSRAALITSKTVAGVIIPQIHYEQDLENTEAGNVGSVMTDGAGSITRSALCALAQELGLPTIPAAFQGRFAGAKGVWYADVASTTASALSITCRDSQVKLKLGEASVRDPSHNTFDIVTPARLSLPSKLSKQIILVLEHNGVSPLTIIDLQTAQLEAIAGRLCLLQSENGSSDSMRERLAKEVDILGGVTAARARHAAPCDARAKGLSRFSADSDDEDLSDDDDGTPSSTTMAPSASSDDSAAGLGYRARSLGVHQRAYDALISGFEPANCAMLARALREVLHVALQTVIRDFAVPVAQSAEAIVIPDPAGVLEEGTIHLGFGDQAPTDPVTGMRVGVLDNMDVLVTRHPCLLPTDIQKVRAVSHPALAAYPDVVIFSTKGQRPLADMLSGGDYDGDLVRVFWGPLTDDFKNAPVHFSCADPSWQQQFFRKDSRKVSHFIESTLRGAGDTDARDAKLCNVILDPLLRPDFRGVYGHLHQVVQYEQGTDCDKAKEFAFKFNNSMDGGKTGLTIKPEVLSRDKREFDRKLPDWFSRHTSADDGRREAQRASHLPPYILSTLAAAGEKASRAIQTKYRQDLEENAAVEVDADLTAPWLEALTKGRLPDPQKNAVLHHVRETLNFYRDLKRSLAAEASRDERRRNFEGEDRITRSPTKNRAPSSPSHPRSSSGASPRTFEELEAYFHAWPSTPSAWPIANIDKDKAAAPNPLSLLDAQELQRLTIILTSCAHLLGAEAKQPSFGFDVAWNTTLGIKAQAVGTRTGAGTFTTPNTTAMKMKIGRLY